MEAKTVAQDPSLSPHSFELFAIICLNSIACKQQFPFAFFFFVCLLFKEVRHQRRMYVGPWQEYKLMRVIKEVKSENERLKRGLSSVASTPRSTSASSSAQPSVRAGVSHRQALDRPRPRPLDRTALIATPTNSERSTQSAPVMNSMTYGTEDPLHHRYGNHPEYQALARGAPLTSTEREAMAGQPGFQRKPTGPTKGDELQERLQRRTTMSMLYSGSEPQSHVVDNRAEIPTRAAQPALLRAGAGARRPNSGMNSKPTRVGNQSAQRRITDARGRGGNNNNNNYDASSPHNVERVVEPPMIRRNVVRDLAAFYDAHIQGQHTRGGENILSSGGVPWEVGNGIDIPGPGPSSNRIGPSNTSHQPEQYQSNPYTHALVPPPPVLPANFQFSGNRIHQPIVAEGSPLQHKDRYDLHSSGHHHRFDERAPMDAVPGNDRERVAQKISLILGGQDALDLHMKRRPYDVGPPPVPPQPYKGVASSTAGSGSTPSQLLGSHSSMSSTRGGGIAASSSSSTTLDSFVVNNNEDRLHQHAEAVLLRASQDRGKVSGQYYKPTASVVEARPTSAAGYQFSVPPPPVLPPDFGASDRFSTQQQPPTGVPSGVTVNAETLDWKSPKKHQPRRTVGVSPSLSMTNGSQRPSSVATDLSVDGEDAGALLNWAASLNQNGGGW